MGGGGGRGWGGGGGVALVLPALVPPKDRLCKPATLIFKTFVPYRDAQNIRIPDVISDVTQG